jgi:atrazine chlorohydrolase/5-methylthioadenosine/S-adenosylhomocysteine deaminase/melamine deaminase
MDPGRQLLYDAWVHIEDSHITSIGKHSEQAPPVADKIIDSRGKVLLPGFINAHTHVSQIMLRGGPSHGRQLYDWLFNVLYPGQRALSPEDVSVAVKLYCMEAIRSGITTINDNVDSAIYPGNVEAAMSVYRETGVRAIYARMFFDRIDPKITSYIETLKARAPRTEMCSIKEETDTAIERIKKIFREYHGAAEGRISVWPAPAITPAVTVEGMKWAQEFARENNIMWTLHMAETDHDERIHWMSPTEFMECHGLLDARLQVAHCVFSDRKDIRLLQRHHVKVASQVVSNAYLGSGLAPIPDMVERGITVGIGTDDANCNDSVNMIGDMKFMAHLHRAFHRDADVLTPERILEMATIDGARSIGMEKEIGSVEPGKKADLILIDLSHPQTTPHHNIAATLVFQAYGNEVDTSIINGQVVMENRELAFIPPSSEKTFLAEAQARSRDAVNRAHMISDPVWRSL